MKFKDITHKTWSFEVIGSVGYKDNLKFEIKCNGYWYIIISHTEKDLVLHEPWTFDKIEKAKDFCKKFDFNQYESKFKTKKQHEDYVKSLFPHMENKWISYLVLDSFFYTKKILTGRILTELSFSLSSNQSN